MFEEKTGILSKDGDIFFPNLLIVMLDKKFVHYIHILMFLFSMEGRWKALMKHEKDVKNSRTRRG